MFQAEKMTRPENILIYFDDDPILATSLRANTFNCLAALEKRHVRHTTFALPAAVLCSLAHAEHRCGCDCH